MMIISSINNPKIKQCIRLRERRERKKTAKFLIEGYRELQRSYDGGQPVETLFICKNLWGDRFTENLIAEVSGDCQVIECDEKVFRKISYRATPDGVLAIAPQRTKKLSDLSWKGNNPLFIIAEAVEKPGNLGTILRSSDAVGADGLIVCDGCTDIYNPNVVRASIGTLFTVPVVEASGTEVLRWVQDQGIKVLAATPDADGEYTKADMLGPVAIMVGSENLGLTDFWMNNADLQVRIPMRGAADSLNVAMATTLLMYEALRQRHA
ncbi:MAG: TrmH family RNA methyltransferase [Chlamydiota bacterium]